MDLDRSKLCFCFYLIIKYQSTLNYKISGYDLVFYLIIWQNILINVDEM